MKASDWIADSVLLARIEALSDQVDRLERQVERLERRRWWRRRS